MFTWNEWPKRAKAAKGRKPDAEIAADVTERVGYEVGRALVNHWLNGRRDPSVSELMALCESIGADPGAILFGVKVLGHVVPPGIGAAIEGDGRTPKQLEDAADRIRRFKQKKQRLRGRVRSS